MAEGEGGGGKRESIGQTLRTRVAGVPIAVFVVGGVGLTVWYLRRRAAASAAAADQGPPPQTAENNPGLADSGSGSLPYMGSPVFLTVTSPNVPAAAGTPTTPPARDPGTKPARDPSPKPSPPPPVWNGPIKLPTVPGTTPKPSPPPPQQNSKSYVVQSGDWLYKIATKLHVSEPALYQLNKAQLDAEARKHGQADSHGGNLIYAGERLLLP